MDSSSTTKKKSSGDGTIGILIGVVIIILLLLFLGVIAIAILYTDRTDGGVPQVQVESGSFLAPCTTTSCQSNFICDGNTFTCKLKEGELCLEASDCATALICSGRCATGATGGLNDFCPCNPGYRCEPDTCNPGSGYNLCKGIGGTECGADCDCVSGICLPDGTCATGAPNAYPCVNNDACSSGNCSLGFCQPVGITTGVLGAACATADAFQVPFCGLTGLSTDNPGASCFSTTGNVLTCNCDVGDDVSGVCVGANQGILSSCDLPASGCTDELICLNATGAAIGLECTGGTGACICVFPYDDPNNPSPGIVCIGGMTSGSNGCYNNNNLGCSTGEMCVSGNCNGASVMAVYTFDTFTNPQLYPGALSTTIERAFPGPTGTISPYKMFGSSTGTTDTIYLVDSIQGFLTINYDINMQVTPNWSQLIPHTITGTDGTINFTRTLIDVGYNGVTFIVAFDETITGSATGNNTTVYTWDPQTNIFTPYNFIAGSGITGTQYTTNNQPITINYIDISPFNQGLTGSSTPNNVPDTGGDVLLVGTIPNSSTLTVYVKTAPVGQRYAQGIIRGADGNGLPMTAVGGLTRFYYDDEQITGSTGNPVCPENCSTSGGRNCPSNPINCPSFYNIALIKSYQFIGPNGRRGPVFPNVLQFSGNVAGIALPIDQFGKVNYQVYDFSIFSPVVAGLSGTTGMNGSAIIMLAHEYSGSQLIRDVVSISFAGVTTILPYRIDNQSRSVATANGYYILSPQSCTSS
jgi:hypothetical protein